MVHLVLASAKGNGLRYFPYSGHLGLTPVKLEGVVLTKKDNDQKVIPAKSITISVRCYESRIGRVGVVQSNVLVDYTKVLWSKPDGQDYDEISDLELPFRITLPPTVGGFSTANFVEYRCIWRVEAILNHIPITGVGSRSIKHSELALVRYDLPPSLPLPRSSGLDREYSKPRAPRLRYAIDSPTSPVGPMDIVSIPLRLQLLEQGVSVKSASVTIERRLDLVEGTFTPPTPSVPYEASLVGPSRQAPEQDGGAPPFSPQEPVPTTSEDVAAFVASTPSLNSSSGSSNPTITPHTIYPSETEPLIPPDPVPEFHPSKTILHPIVAAESAGAFSVSDSGVWSKTLTFQWPAPKSNSRWAIGETLKSDLVSVRFFARVKIVVATSAGAETLELQEVEIRVASTNESERQVAISRHHEVSSSSDNAARSKSKSPRRSRRERGDRGAESNPPTPPSGKFEHSHKTSSASAHFPSKPSKGKGSSSRRPHTSAGPRDKVHNYTTPRVDSRTRQSSHQQPQEDGSMDDDDDSPQSGTVFRRWRSARAELPSTAKTDVLGYLFAPRISSVPSGGSSGTSSATSAAASVSTSSISSQESDDMREWEEELAKIEVASRQSSSSMLAFNRKTPPNIRSKHADKID